VYLAWVAAVCMQVFLTISILMGEGMYMVLRVLLSSECWLAVWRRTAAVRQQQGCCRHAASCSPQVGGARAQHKAVLTQPAVPKISFDRVPVCFPALQAARTA
jgi:N-methylhydantoinase B/oxoprolinase/acetone carboxylase alpha subunit